MLDTSLRFSINSLFSDGLYYLDHFFQGCNKNLKSTVFMKIKLMI